MPTAKSPSGVRTTTYLTSDAHVIGLASHGGAVYATTTNGVIAVHHVWGNPIWPFMPTSSFGCLVFDALIAIWFLAGAPSRFEQPPIARRDRLSV